MNILVQKNTLCLVPNTSFNTEARKKADLKNGLQNNYIVPLKVIA